MFFQLWVCLIVSMVSTVLSVVALIIYSVDMHKNPDVPCIKTEHDTCPEIHYATVGISFFHVTMLSCLKCVLWVTLECPMEMLTDLKS